MSKTDNEAPETVRTARPVWRARALALAAALAVNLAAWVIASVGGVELVTSMPDQAASDIGPEHVASATLLFGGLGWLARAVLDRIAKRRAALIWTIGAVAVFVLDAFPVIAVEASAGTRAFLAILHVLTAAVLIPVLGRRLPRE